MADPDHLAFLGTGLMGDPMVRRLIAAGRSVAVWNRTAAKAARLAGLGADFAPSPAEAVRGARIVFTMLADGPAVTEALFASGAAAAMVPGSLVVDMSSIPPALARDHASRLAAQGVGHLDAPVSGGTLGAERGTLAIMVGGGQAHFAEALPVLRLLGAAVWVGPDGSGQLAKLANQAIVAVTIGAVAEALLLAAAGGADPARVRQALRGGFADSLVLEQHGARMLSRAWVPGGRTRTQVKDLDAIRTVADELGLALPLTSRATELFEASAAAGRGDHDHSALLLELESRNPGRRVGNGADRCPLPAA